MICIITGKPFGEEAGLLGGGGSFPPAINYTQPSGITLL